MQQYRVGEASPNLDRPDHTITSFSISTTPTGGGTSERSKPARIMTDRDHHHRHLGSERFKR